MDKHDGVDGVVGAADGGDGVEVGQGAIYRFEVGLVGFLHAQRVAQGVVQGVAQFENEHVYVPHMAHGQGETVGLYAFVEQDGVLSVGTGSEDGECVGERVGTQRIAGLA